MTLEASQGGEAAEFLCNPTSEISHPRAFRIERIGRVDSLSRDIPQPSREALFLFSTCIEGIPNEWIVAPRVDYDVLEKDLI